MSTNRRQLILEEYGGRCFYCGVEVHVPTPPHYSSSGDEMGRQFNVDHKTPKTRGGTGARSNLVCSCQKCNFSKGTQTVEEFRRKKQQKKDKQIEAIKYLRRALNIAPDLLFSDEILAQIKLVEEKDYEWVAFYGETESNEKEVSA